MKNYYALFVEVSITLVTRVTPCSRGAMGDFHSAAHSTPYFLIDRAGGSCFPLPRQKMTVIVQPGSHFTGKVLDLLLLVIFERDLIYRN